MTTTTLFLTVDVATYNRFAALVRDGVPADQVLKRLLDREPHDHGHRCPTCSRLAHRPVPPTVGQPRLFDDLEAAAV